MKEITSTIKNRITRLPSLVHSGVEAAGSLPIVARDVVNANISRLHLLSKRLQTADEYLQGWKHSAEAPAKRPAKATPHPSVSGPTERKFLSDTFDLMEKTGKYSSHPEVKNMSQVLRQMNNKGRLRFDEKLNGKRLYFTFDKNVYMGDTFKNLSQEKDLRLYALTVNAGLLAHEATHSHYGVAAEKPLRGRLSPPRVGLETMRSIRDHFEDRGESEKVRIVNLAIQDYTKGAEADGFTAQELQPRIVNQPIRSRR